MKFWDELTDDIKNAIPSPRAWAKKWGHAQGLRGFEGTREPERVDTTNTETKAKRDKLHPGQEDELDAFLHAFTSAILIAWNPIRSLPLVGEQAARLIAEFLGQLNEDQRDDGTYDCAATMDFFNNNVGRGLAPDAATMQGWLQSYNNPNRKIAEIIAQAVRTGKTINSLSDPRMPTKCWPKGKEVYFYTWRTKSDEDVRWSHAVREGMIFAWDSQPVGGHPGQAPNCRCWAQPYMLKPLK